MCPYMRPIQMLLNAQLMNTDWVSSAQFTAPDSPLGKKEAEPAALKLRHAFQKFDQPMHTGIEHNDLQTIVRRILQNFKCNHATT